MHVFTSARLRTLAKVVTCLERGENTRTGSHRHGEGAIYGHFERQNQKLMDHEVLRLRT